MYTGNGDVQEFRYTTAFQQAFMGQNGGIATLKDLDNGVWAPGPGANVFVTNHDTERSGDSLNFTASNLYTNAMILSLAHPYGTPTILSSYTFKGKTATTDGTGDGAPNNGESLRPCAHFCVAHAPLTQVLGRVRSTAVPMGGSASTGGPRSPA
jgi:hypothetical protein